ncbi:MAG: Holliday junction branch migration protein RuvA [Bacteroidota bacterium]|jgi:Holliday junction DNA helicase RuvA
MINHLNGKLIEKNPAYCIIECGGVGYFVNISLHTFSQLGENEAIRLLTHLHITEDAHTLFGFHQEEERKLFRSLITVSGIGCNTARMMLSSMNPTEIESCIASEDISRLKKIKGIGEKTAQRLVLELKGKIRKESNVSGMITSLSVREEALSALLTLGFQRNTVEAALDKLIKNSPGTGVEEIIRQALKSL